MYGNPTRVVICQAKFLDTFLNTLYNPLVDWGWLPWRREIL